MTLRRAFTAYVWVALAMIPIGLAVNLLLGSHSVWSELTWMVFGFMWVSTLVLAAIAAVATVLLKKV